MTARIRKFEGVSSTAPATTSMGIPDMAATVHLNTGSWSSQLRFYKLNRDGTPINTTEFVQPSLITASLWLMMAVRPILSIELQIMRLQMPIFGISDGSAKDKLEWKNALLKWTAE